MENSKTYYMGSGDFSSMVLDRIHNNFSDLTVITSGNKDLPILKVAKKNRLRTIQVCNKFELEKLLEKEKPVINIVCDFGIIITKNTLEKFDPIINIHPSILPKYRGCSPIISAILNNDEYTGVSLMKMNEGIDEGPVYKIERIKVDKKEDIFSLSSKLSKVAADLIIKNIKQIITGKLKPRKQNNKKSICTSLISKEQGLLNIEEKAELIERKIRAYKKWPGIFTYIEANGKNILVKITDAEISERKGSGSFHLDKNNFEIKTADKYLSIKKIQPEGKKEMDIKNFICGYKDIKIRP